MSLIAPTKTLVSNSSEPQMYESLHSQVKLLSEKQDTQIKLLTEKMDHQIRLMTHKQDDFIVKMDTLMNLALEDNKRSSKKGKQGKSKGQTTRGRGGRRSKWVQGLKKTGNNQEKDEEDNSDSEDDDGSNEEDS